MGIEAHWALASIGAGHGGATAARLGPPLPENALLSPSNETPPDAAPPANGSQPHPLVFMRKLVRGLQDGFAAKFGIGVADREDLVGVMLCRQEEDAVSYWLQLLLSIGIATLGLVLNSTGVVIGAMLISPLMTPIVGLGMGLTTGSPFLTLRSAVRVGLSVAVVIGVAAGLTRLLPFHEITSEIAGRTAPTLIDLAIASFCALAAGFTTVSRASDTVAAAAGTAIGIALVPPLCVSGFGFGVASAKVAGGAALLFTANLCAIVLFTVLVFYCVGYNRIDISRLESEHVKAAGRVTKAAAALRRAFGTRYGPYLRFLLPVALVGGVFMPLSRALTEVAWKVRVQTEVARLLDEVTAEDYTMRSAVKVEHGQVAIRLVLIATRERAAELEDELRTRVAALAASVPKIEVLAVPDFASLQQIADSVSAPLVAPVERGPDLDDLRQRVESRLDKWPRGRGAILYWGVGFDGETCVVDIAHVGTPGGDFLELLAETLQTALGRPVVLRERAVALSTWTADDDQLVAWLPKLAVALESATVPGISACVTSGPATRKQALPPSPPSPVPAATEPPAPPDAPAPDAPSPLPTTPLDPIPAPVPTPATFIDVSLSGASTAADLLRNPGDSVVVSEGRQWSVAVVRGPCSDKHP